MVRKEDDCSGVVVGRGWCRKHYTRWQRHGDVGPTPRQQGTRNVTCAASGCTKVFPTGPKSSRKYCSPACFRSSYTHRPKFPKKCGHCGSTYQPVGTSQRYCPDCLGPGVPDSRGVMRYAGSQRLTMYGVSHPEWVAMLSLHDGSCWICKDRPATDLDHRHTDGQVRGALCSQCNTRLHVLEEVAWIAKATRYLEETEGTQWWRNK